ncbi:hypothetical protein J6590_084121 [Homalodisca vitripennis]|nr:hypothetical protein J6590_084121 [Homalodisca vitripennis]
MSSVDCFLLVLVLCHDLNDDSHPLKVYWRFKNTRIQEFTLQVVTVYSAHPPDCNEGWCGSYKETNPTHGALTPKTLSIAYPFRYCQGSEIFGRVTLNQRLICLSGTLSQLYPCPKTANRTGLSAFKGDGTIFSFWTKSPKSSWSLRFIKERKYKWSVPESL